MLATAVTQWGQNQNEIASFLPKKQKQIATIIFLYIFVKDGMDRLSGK